MRASSLTPFSVYLFLLVALRDRRGGCSQTLPVLVLPCLLSWKHTHLVMTSVSAPVARKEDKTRTKQWEEIHRIPWLDTEFLYTQIIHHALYENMSFSHLQTRLDFPQFIAGLTG